MTLALPKNLLKANKFTEVNEYAEIKNWTVRIT